MQCNVRRIVCGRTSTHFFTCGDQSRMNETIRLALLTQSPGHGDSRPPPTLHEVTEFAEKHFKGTKKQAFDGFLATCAENGSQPVIGKLSVTNMDLDQAKIALSYFGGHIEYSPDEPKGHLGPRYMSYSLQIKDHTAFKPDPTVVLKNRDLPLDQVKAEIKSGSRSKVSSSYPAGWTKKCLTIGEIESEGNKNLVSDAFNDPSGLQIVLLLNKLYGGVCYPDPDALPLLESKLFPLRNTSLESDCTALFDDIIELVKDLLDVMKPALQIVIGANPVISGTTDISVAIWGVNERGELQCIHTAIIELKKPGIAYRAASMLAFGDKPTDDDYTALGETIGSPGATNRKLDLSKDLLKMTSNEPSKDDTQYGGDNMIHRYTCGGMDITENLEESYFNEPLDALRAGLVKASRLASLNSCSSMTVSDGLTLVSTSLRDLKESQPDLITANFDSHYVMDLTEVGSALKLVQFLINKYMQDPRARQLAMMMLTAAADAGVSDDDITPEQIAKLQELKNQLWGHKFESKVYSPDTGLIESARVFTKVRDSIIKDVLAKFVPAYGAIAECGEYKSTDFGFLEYFRVDELQGIPTDEDPIAGRSRCVVWVNFHGKYGGSLSEDERRCVLKVYEADTASIERLERELKAYLRIAELSVEDQRHIAKLVAFGSIDLGAADPRLFILTEYVENSCEEPTSKEVEREISKVCDILKSVGVNHNDLVDRNYVWQNIDGQRSITVFDFDHATFDDVATFTSTQSRKKSGSRKTSGSVKRKYQL